MPDQVPEEVKRERIERLIDVVQRIARERNEERVGRGGGGARRGPEPHRPGAPARPHASQHDRELPRRRASRASSSRCESRRPRRRPWRGTRRASRSPTRFRDDSARHACASPRLRSKRREARGRPLRREWALTLRNGAAAASSWRSSGRRRPARAPSPRRSPTGIAGEVVSADSMQVYRGLPDPHEPARAADAARRDLAARPRGLGRRVPAPRARRDRRDPRRPAARRSSRAAPGLYLRAALAELDLPPAPPPGARERWELPLRRGRGRGRARRPRRARPGRCRARPPERPAPRRPRARAGRRRRLARARARAASGREETRHPTLVVGLDVSAETLARRIDERTRADGRAGGGGRGRRARSHGRSRRRRAR